MSDRRFPVFWPSPGSILSLLMIGMVLLSALVYYRAVKIQRFLEPALALSQPRNEFSKRINGMFQREFGKKPIKGLEFRMGSIHVPRSLLFTGEGILTEQGQAILKKLARILVALLRDEQASAEISQILISARVASHGGRGMLVSDQMNAYIMVGFIQNALFKAEPDLALHYATSFATVTQAGDQPEDSGVILIRVVPSEFLHIKVLERLEKYSY